MVILFPIGDGRFQRKGDRVAEKCMIIHWKEILKKKETNKHLVLVLHLIQHFYPICVFELQVQPNRHQTDLAES